VADHCNIELSSTVQCTLAFSQQLTRRPCFVILVFHFADLSSKLHQQTCS